MATNEVSIQLSNTLSGKKEILKTHKPGHVNMYMCGPTVYGYTHVGNARAAITGDLVARTLEFAGYKVNYARNVTDIDDKIIKAANERGISSDAHAKEFTQAYMGEMKDMGVRNPDHNPHATEHVPAILKMISGLIDKGLAYAAETPFGKDVYFRVTKFEGYGKLSKRKLDDMLAGARVEVGEAKENPLDFALWKSAKPGEPSWASPWGQGRPGWHIECSAMIDEIFAEDLDIHMGGLDLIFPHHENEIAQSEGFHSHGKPLAPYWLHNGMLTLAREKMSKSLGNIFSTRKFLDMYGPETLRMMMLQHHYRSPIDFSEEGILRTEALVERLYTCKDHANQSSSATTSDLPPELQKLGAEVMAALSDDFNSAKALGFILKAARVCFRENRADYWKAWGEGSLPALNKVYGVCNEAPAAESKLFRERRLKRLGVTNERASQIEAKLQEREVVRKNKDFAASDRLRLELENEGIMVMDGPDGSAWTLKSAP